MFVEAFPKVTRTHKLLGRDSLFAIVEANFHVTGIYSTGILDNPESVSNNSTLVGVVNSFWSLRAEKCTDS